MASIRMEDFRDQQGKHVAIGAHGVIFSHEDLDMVIEAAKESGEEKPFAFYVPTPRELSMG